MQAFCETALLSEYKCKNYALRQFAPVSNLK